VKVFHGIPSSSGIAIGHALPLKGVGFNVKRAHADEKELEEQIALFQKAVEKTKKELKKIKNTVKHEIGLEESAIFDAHILLVNDPNLVDKSIKKATEEHVSMEYAFTETLSGLVKVFENMPDEYLKERANDLLDVGKRILKNYLGIQMAPELAGDHTDLIIVAHNISPSDMVELGKKRIGGLVTEVGGTTSHAAIMARSLEVPAIVGVSNLLSDVRPDDLIIVDSNNNRVIVDPDEETVKEYQALRREYVRYIKSLEKLRNEEAVTRDGKRIKLEINMELVNEADLVNSYGADGVGLFRTEYLFMRNVLPTEEEQAETYQYISQIIYPKEVVIRTADLGGDKFISHFEVPKEMNPFLGLRGIRLCLEYKDFFKTQLKAILRASKLKNVRIMFPMISGVDELRQARQVLEEAKDELKERGTEFDEEIPVGIMVEVPSAAVISDILAAEVDFFSIGTNDLIQYTLAVDRVNEKISYLYNPIHPAILRLIKMVVNNGHQNNIPVAMCGQMAGMAEYALLLIGMDLDVLSVAPANLLEMKKIIRAVDYEKCKQIVQASIQYNDVRIIKEHFQRYNRELLSGVLFDYGKEGDDE